MPRYPFMKVMILNYLLHRDEFTGYDFIKYCRERGISASSGTVYPQLKDLTAQGLLYCQKKNHKKFYSLTDVGKERITETALMHIPDMVKNLFFRNISLAAQMDWSQVEDVQRLLRSVRKTGDVLQEYIEELPGDG